MSGAFDRKLRDVRRRWSFNILLEQLALVAMLAGVATALAVVTERAIALPFLAGWHVAAAGSLAAVAALALWLRRRPSPIQAALLLDERLATRERFSTALAMASSEDPFAEAARDEAHHAAEKVRLDKQFPVRFTRRWIWAAGAWAAFGGCLLLPEMDLLGRGAERDKAIQAEQELNQAKARVAERIAPIRSRVEQLGEKDLAKDLAGLGDLDKAFQADDVNRQAIQKLGDLDKRLSKMQKDAAVQAVKDLEEMLQRLRNGRDEPAPELSHAIAAGDFSKAGKLLEDLKQRLEDGKLSKEQREALARQLKNLSDQLAKLAANTKDLEDALKQAGLDKDLAKLSPEQLREALKKKGLSEEQIKKLVNKAKSNQLARQQCKKLGKCLGNCAGGLRAGDGQGAAGQMAGAMDKLDDLEAAKDRLAQIEATQAEIDAAIALLGKGQCPGQNPRIGNAPGSDNPVPAWGDRPTGGPEATKTAKTGVKNQTQDGPIIASTLFKGQQIKGASKQEYKAVVAAAKDHAAEAVSDNKVPREYQQAVKKYFDDMGKTDE